MKENDEKIEYQLEETDTVTEPEKKPSREVKDKSRWWLKYVITVALLSVFTFMLAWGRGAFVTPDKKQLFKLLSDAFAVPGGLTLGLGLLTIASNGGTFDMLSYGVRSFFRLFKRDPLDRKYGDFYEYRKYRQGKKRNFLYLVIVGGAFVLVGIVFVIAYRKV